MRKKSTSLAGFFNPRFVTALVFCSIGVCLALIGFAQTPPLPSQPGGGVGQFAPVVRDSLSNGISPNLRDLPLAPRVHGPPYFANEVLPIHPLPLTPFVPFPDSVQQSNPPPLAMPTPMLTFEGMNQGDGCGNCIPPDPNGAVGPNHYAEMVNSSFAIYSKTGTRLAGPTHINALWVNLPGPCKDYNDGDPVVVYDHLADRWVLSQFAVNGGNGPYDECIAVSTTSDPTGSYYVYDFHLSDTVFDDYPKLGVWPDAYYMTTNQFGGPGQTFIGAGAFAFERDRMLVGLSARMLFADLSQVNSSFGGMLPSYLDGPLPPAGSPNYFAEVDSIVNSPSLGPDAMRIWKFHVDWSNTANSTFGLNGQPNFVLPVASWNPSQCVESQGTCVPQMGSTTQLDVIGDRIMYRLPYRNFGDHESLLINHSVLADARIGVRWYEVRDLSTTPTIYQQSTFAPVDTLYRWMGSIAMDRSGNIAVGYSTSSAATFPSISYAGRLANDPLNQLTQGETQMFAGLGPENVQFFIPPVGRWGDYTALTVDPTDGCSFWYVNEYFPDQTIPDPTAPWHTRIGKFKFPQCVAIVPSPTPTPSSTPTATSTATATATATATSTPACPPTGHFIDDLEPTQEPGWTFQVAQNNFPASATWALAVDPQAHSATHSFTSDATAPDIKDDRLIAPPQALTATSHLIFWHRFIFENTFDGGVLEVSTNGGASWVDVGTASFISGGYNGTIDTAFQSPIAGRQAWTGTSPSSPNMNRVEVNLGAFAGSSVFVRWRLALDNGVLVPGVGWWVDDIEFTNICGTGTPTPTGTPTATATGTPGGTATPAGTPTPPPACLNSPVVVVTDPSGDQGVGNPPESDILSVNAYEDYTYINSERLVFVLSVNSNFATVPPDQIWNVIWTFNGTTYYVAMKSDDNSFVSYEYGTIANNFVTTLGALDAGSYDNHGDIRMAISRANVGNPGVGAVLTAVNGDTQLNIGGILFSDEDPTSNGTYTVRAKAGACSPIPLPTPGSATYVHGGMTFSPNYTTRAPYIGQDVEPSVRCDKFGNCYVAAIRGVPGGTDLWYFDLRPTVNGSPNPNYDPFMRNPQYRGQPDRIAPVACINDPIPCGGTVGGDGGGDVDIAVGFNSEAVESASPTLAYASLVLANISTQRSTDRGATFVPNPGGNITGGVPVDDRQWLEFFGPNTVYLFYRTLEPAISQIQRSTDGGLTYGNAATAGAIGQAGGIAVDQNDGTVYVSGSSGSVSVGIPPAPGLAPITYTTHNVAGSGNSHLFFTVKVAADGTVYACYSNDHDIFVRYSTDKGNTWSAAIRVSDGPETLTAVFPWMTTGPVPGTIGVVWYGSDKLTTLDDSADWHVFYSLGTNVKGSSPTFRQVEASDHVIHGANISENGFDPTGNNPPNRNLADYFQVAFDPTGAAVIGYCDDHNDLSGHAFVTRQISGPGANGSGIPTPLEGSAVPPPANEPLPRAVDVGGIPGSQVTDFKDDVRLGGNPELGGTAVLPVDDPLDILSVLYTAEPTSAVNSAPVLVVKMKVSDMTTIPASSNWRMTFTANAPNSILSPTYEYSFGLSDRGDGFFVRAATDANGAQTFLYGKAVRTFNGGITYTDLGAADCGFFDQAAKTVTIKVALSKFNTALPAGHAQIAPGSTLVGLRASAFFTAGSGASGSNKADTARGGTQFVVAVGPLTPCGAAASTPTPTVTPSSSPSGTPTPTATPTPLATVSISGNLSYCSNPSLNPVPGVTLTLTGSSSATTVSDSSGNYQFSVGAGGNYTVTPSKTGLIPGSMGSAINTVDAIAVQRHFLLLGTPLSGCRLTAADVNGDSAVNTVDTIAIQRFYLGYTTGTANVGEYQFNPASRSYTAVLTNQTNQNYDTLVFGDVASGFVYRPEGSGDNMNSNELAATVAEIMLPNAIVEPSKSNFIAAVTASRIDGKNKLVGFQGDFTFDERVIAFENPPVQKGGLTAGNWNVSGNVLAGKGPIRTLRISAFSNDFTPLSESGTLFELRMTRVKKAAQGTPLLWAAPLDQFIFIDADLNTQSTGHAAAGDVSFVPAKG